ncbi:CBS domain-containing protein [Streptomyces sp. TRM68367]|nr:CBS domain-containing protein [Streptomyces sp. TRM68367]
MLPYRRARYPRQGDTRLLVREHGAVLGSVHARDALVARAHGRTASARDLARPVPELSADATVADAIDLLRRRRATLAVVRDAGGRLTGMVTLDDLLSRLPQRRAA